MGMEKKAAHRKKSKQKIWDFSLIRKCEEYKSVG